MFLLLFPLRPNNFSQHLTLETLHICPYLNITDQISHPRDTAEKSLDLHALLVLHAHYEGVHKRLCVPVIYYVLNSFVHDIFLCLCRSKMFQFCRCFIRYVRRIHVVSLFCALLKRQEQVLRFPSSWLWTSYRTGHWQNFCFVSHGFCFHSTLI
jgi:hypothetical protein